MTENPKIHAREILSLSLVSVHSLEYPIYDVTYDDGTTSTERKKEIIFNRHCWRLFFIHANTPITPNCAVASVLKGGFLDGDTHIKLLEAIFKHICKHNQLKAYKDKEPLLQQVQLAHNDILNNIVHRASSHVATIDATDYTKLIKDPVIKELHSNLRATPESMDKTYKGIKSYINNTPTSNQFAAAYRSKAINDNQANQCIGPRGFISDLDRTVFKQPVMNGFIRGMGNLYELIIESLTAAKSLNANDTHIKTSEYASRRIQLLTMSVTNVVPGDCGSTEYIDFFITPSRLENMKGIYYFDEQQQKLVVIEGNEKHLHNTVIKIRNAFGCQLDNPQHICSTCLGDISLNFKENSNLGYTMTAYLMEKMTQRILSTKHLTHSVKKSSIILEGDVNKYFYTDTENNIYFNRDIDLKGIQLILPNNRMNKLVDVLNLPHTNISLTKVGELETIGYRDTKTSKASVIETLNVSYKDRESIITTEFLKYVKSVKLESDARGNFVIPMDGFDLNQPVFNNPLKETNLVSFVNRLASMIETNKDKITDPIDKFTHIFDTIIDQLQCNMSVVQTIVYATTTYNTYDGDYRLGRKSQHSKCENSSVLFSHRAASQLMVYQKQIKDVISQAPVFFNNHKRMPHPMDVLFAPDKVK